MSLLGVRVLVYAQELKKSGATQTGEAGTSTEPGKKGTPGPPEASKDGWQQG